MNIPDLVWRLYWPVFLGGFGIGVICAPVLWHYAIAAVGAFERWQWRRRQIRFQRLPRAY